MASRITLSFTTTVASSKPRGFLYSTSIVNRHLESRAQDDTPFRNDSFNFLKAAVSQVPENFIFIHSFFAA
jgi:hypothetical protein